MDNKLKIATKAAMAAIPYVGGSIVSVWDELSNQQLNRKVERLCEFITDMQIKIDSTKYSINPVFFAQDDGFDIFEMMLKKYINERIKEKRKLYENVYLQALTAQEVDYDKIEREMRFIEQLTRLELYILRIFDEAMTDPNFIHKVNESVNIDHVRIFRDKYMCDYYLIKVLPYILPSAYSDDEMVESLEFLTQSRVLVDNVVDKKYTTSGENIPAALFENILTRKGLKFVRILRDI